MKFSHLHLYKLCPSRLICNFWKPTLHPFLWTIIHFVMQLDGFVIIHTKLAFHCQLSQVFIPWFYFPLFVLIPMLVFVSTCNFSTSIFSSNQIVLLHAIHCRFFPMCHSPMLITSSCRSRRTMQHHLHNVAFSPSLHCVILSPLLSIRLLLLSSWFAHIFFSYPLGCNPHSTAHSTSFAFMFGFASHLYNSLAYSM